MKKELTKRRGFTLVELLVAMAVTLVLVSLTVVITRAALDTWRKARTEIRAAGQARIILNALGRDLESMVSRVGNNESQWLIVNSEQSKIGPSGGESPNAARITFFTGAPDRYNGNVGPKGQRGSQAEGNRDNGGDVCAVSYQLKYGDPVWGDGDEKFSTFVLYRKLLNPDETYNGVTGSDDLVKTFDAVSARADLADLICENVYELTVTFVVEYSKTENGDPVTRTVNLPVMSTRVGSDVVKSFALTGRGIVPNGDSKTDFLAGRIKAVEMAISVISDEGLRILKRRNFGNDEERARFLEENSFRYTKSVTVPQG